jgi:hypothetical protein
MKLSRSFWVVITGAAICLAGIAGIAFFLFFPEYWNGSHFIWMPISQLAVALGTVLILASLIIGLVSGFITHLRRRKVETRK